MLGVPEADRAELSRLEDIAAYFGAETHVDECIGVTMQAMEYAAELAECKRRQPDEDLMTAIVHAEIDGSWLSDGDVRAQLLDDLGGG